MLKQLPCGVVSLLKMLEFYAEGFVRAITQFGAWELRAGQESDSQIKPELLNALYADISVFANDCVLQGFKSSAQQCGRIIEAIESTKGVMTCGRVRDELRDLRKRFEDDVKSELFFHLSLEEAELYNSPAKH